MLDFSKLQTPPHHGDVLFSPDPSAWGKAARANHDLLGRCEYRLLDSTLAQWRKKTRQALTGSDDGLVFVLGHQPEFFHCGVWAKHVAACRAAAALDGIAVNLVVDNDAPKSTSLALPAMQDSRLVQVLVPSVEYRSGLTYEQISSPSANEVNRFERAVRDHLGDRFDTSQMPTFFDAFAKSDGDWVDRSVQGRRAIEQEFGISLHDKRVSRAWCSPLLIDMLAKAEAFASSYNRALATYRREHRVRGKQRPIPDLLVEDGRIEVPMWVYSANGPRRRLFVEGINGARRLLADDIPIGEIPAGHLTACSELEHVLADLGDWQLRPRALTLTIWARLLLADLFVHGIGGAKYDRISDTIIADYYGVQPPRMACVSATMYLDLPSPAATPQTVHRLREALRDLEFNPQRNLEPASDLEAVFERRSQAVRRASRLRDADRHNALARKQAFREIRQINATALAARPGEFSLRSDALQRAQRDLHQYDITHDRTYFFGLFDRSRLETLIDALPNVDAFRV